MHQLLVLVVDDQAGGGFASSGAIGRAERLDMAVNI